MNKNRRKEISKCITSLEQVISEAKEKLEEIQSDIENIRDEEQGYMDNMPENLQDSDRYYTAEAAVDNLDNAINSLESIIGELDSDEIVDYLNEAAE